MEPIIVATQIWFFATSIVVVYQWITGRQAFTGEPLTYEVPHAQRPLTRNNREHND